MSSIDMARALARQTEGAEFTILAHSAPPVKLQANAAADSAGSTAPSESESTQPVGMVKRAILAIEQRAAPSPPPDKHHKREALARKRQVLHEQHMEEYTNVRIRPALAATDRGAFTKAALEDPHRGASQVYHELLGTQTERTVARVLQVLSMD